MPCHVQERLEKIVTRLDELSREDTAFTTYARSATLGAVIVLLFLSALPNGLSGHAAPPLPPALRPPCPYLIPSRTRQGQSDPTLTPRALTVRRSVASFMLIPALLAFAWAWVLKKDARVCQLFASASKDVTGKSPPADPDCEGGMSWQQMKDAGSALKANGLGAVKGMWKDAQKGSCMFWKALFYLWSAFWLLTLFGALMALLFPSSAAGQASAAHFLHAADLMVITAENNRRDNRRDT